MAKEQLGHLYTFGTMTVLIFSPFAIFWNQSLIFYLVLNKGFLYQSELSTFMILGLENKVISADEPLTLNKVNSVT